jgi:hypothetical protein
LPSKGLCRRRAFATSKGLCHIEGPFVLSQRSTCKASIYSIALSAATSFDQHSLVMQRPPTKPFQDSSVCE